MGSIKGISQTIAELRKFGADAEKMINAETEGIANEIALHAKQLAPKNFGKLDQGISHEKINPSNYKVTVNVPYAAYMEFGTGSKIQIPAEFKDMAATFKGGTGKSFADGLEAIKIWCRAKGIDEKAAYPIFAKILGAGVNPQPFLYPAWIKGKADYLSNLNKLLKNYKRKI